MCHRSDASKARGPRCRDLARRRAARVRRPAPSEGRWCVAVWRMRLPHSRLRKAPISPIVLINGAGNMIVEFLSTPISTIVWRLRSCSAKGWAIISSGARPSSPAACAAPWAATVADATEPELHAPLVLPDHIEEAEHVCPFSPRSLARDVRTSLLSATTSRIAAAVSRKGIGLLNVISAPSVGGAASFAARRRDRITRRVVVDRKSRSHARRAGAEGMRGPHPERTSPSSGSPPRGRCE
jgi:hypothetical protein